MSDNPLAGVSIPSVADIVRKAVDDLGGGVIDLRNPLQRQRLRDRLEQSINHGLQWELERAITAVTEKAVRHVFAVTRDSAYQDKRRRYYEKRKEQRMIAKAKQEEMERQVRRMDYSKQKLVVSKTTVQ